MKYRKKPVVIDAVQFTGENSVEVTEFLGGYGAGDTHQWDSNTRKGLTIITLEGPLHAGVGDWIIRGGHGEYWPVRSDIFPTLYEPV